MKTIAADKSKDRCLEILDEVGRTRSTVVITKHGRPVAQLVPCGPPRTARGLAGSVLSESGDPFGTGETWDSGSS